MPQPHPLLLIMMCAHTHRHTHTRALWGEGYMGQWVPPENDILSCVPPPGYLAWASMGNGKETVWKRDYLHEGAIVEITVVWQGERSVCYSRV